MSIREDLFDLTEKVALVTGASRGLGKAMALALAQSGCHVALNARSSEALQEVDSEIKKLGRKTALVPGDVSDEAQVKTLVTDAHKALGQIDILVNNAGIWGGGYFVRLKKPDWDEVVKTNMTGAFLVAKEVSRVMMKQRSGKIINVASVLGLRASPQALAYCAVKGAVVQMTRVMGLELAAAGIQVNAIAPGMFDTDMTRSYTKDKEDAMQAYLERIPTKRIGQPEELAGLIIFLASKASDHMIGQTIVIDGGESLV